MIEITQTITTAPNANCFATCVACILELPLSDVPNFHGADWFDRWQSWLAKRNLVFLCWPPDIRPPGYSLMHAKSPRGDWNHSVVAFNGQIVWDPSPQRDMGVGEVKEWTTFGMLDPSEPVGI